MSALGKIEAAERNLKEAIRLFFEERDPVAVHTLAAAAQGILRDLARGQKLEHLSIIHDNPLVPEQERRKWLKAINAPRNFFKHADNDPEAIIEFAESANIGLLLDAVLLYGTVTKKYLSETSVFLGWFTTANPEMRASVSGNQIGDYCVRNNISPSDMSSFLKLIGTRILIDPWKTSSESNYH